MGFKKWVLLFMLSGNVFSMTQEETLGEPACFPYGDVMMTFYRAPISMAKLETVNSRIVYYTSSDKVPFYPTGELYAEIHGESTPILAYLLEKYHLECKENKGNGVFILRVLWAEDPVKIAESIYKEKKQEIDAIEPRFSTLTHNVTTEIY